MTDKSRIFTCFAYLKGSANTRILKLQKHACQALAELGQNFENASYLMSIILNHKTMFRSKPLIRLRKKNL